MQTSQYHGKRKPEDELEPGSAKRHQTGEREASKVALFVRLIIQFRFSRKVNADKPAEDSQPGSSALSTAASPALASGKEAKASDAKIAWKIKELTARAERAAEDAKTNLDAFNLMKPDWQKGKKRMLELEKELDTAKELLQDRNQEISAMEDEKAAKDRHIKELEATLELANMGVAPEGNKIVRDLGITLKCAGKGSYVALCVDGKKRLEDGDVCYLARIDGFFKHHGVECMTVTYFHKSNANGAPFYTAWQKHANGSSASGDQMMVALNKRLPKDAEEEQALFAYLQQKFPSATFTNGNIPKMA